MPGAVSHALWLRYKCRQKYKASLGYPRRPCLKLTTEEKRKKEEAATHTDMLRYLEP